MSHHSEGFFNKSVNFDLLEKFADLYPWSSDCYPVYIWKGRLFLACLEPPKMKANPKVCFAIAPFSAMERAWREYHKKQEVSPPPSSVMDFDFSSLDTDSPKEKSNKEKSKPVSGTDFSSDQPIHNMKKPDVSPSSSNVTPLHKTDLSHRSEHSQKQNIRSMTKKKKLFPIRFLLRFLPVSQSF